MRKILWSEICREDECIHLANVKLTGGHPPDQHDHNFFECFLVSEGKGTNIIGGQNVDLQPGQLHFIRPELKHCLKVGGKNTLTFTNVAFKAEMMNNIWNDCKYLWDIWTEKSIERILILTENQQNKFKRLVAEISPGLHSNVDALFFLYGLERILRPVDLSLKGKNPPDWLLHILPLAMEPENLQSGHKRLLELSSCSSEHLCRTFRKYLNTTPTRWISARRIGYACHLLETTQKEILEICFDCGFESPAYFHNCFKKETGLTPFKYRKRATNVQS